MIGLAREVARAFRSLAGRAWVVYRDRFAAVGLVCALGLLLAFTGKLARSYRAMEHHLAEEAEARGVAALQAGRPGEAVEAFRTALVYSRGNENYELRLAQSLLGAGREPEARSYLQTLWERRPADAIVNLELARLDAREGEADGAVRHYRSAIHGVWPSAPAVRRQEVRHELAALLLSHGQKDEATAELIAIAADLPPRAAPHVNVGRLFLSAGDSARALDVFERALAIEPTNAEALAGAGDAAFRIGDHRRARLYLRRAANAGLEERVSPLLETVTLLAEIDPYVPGLSSLERRRRATRAFVAAQAVLQSCPDVFGAPAPERMEAMALRARARGRRDVDFVEDALALVTEVAEATAACDDSPRRRALAVIARQRAESLR